MESAFAARVDFDLSLEDEYMCPAVFDSVPLCADFGEFISNDLLPQPHPQQTTCNTVNEFALDPLNSANYGEIINPDDFLNDIPCDSSVSPSNRDTPSPSDSQKSYDSVPSSGGFDGCHVVPMHFDSPPISPQTPASPSDSATAVVKPFGQLRRVKIVPKNSSRSDTVGKTITKKTIVLSAKDYQALMANMQAQPSNNTIILKATSTNKPPVGVGTVQKEHQIALPHVPKLEKRVVLPKPVANTTDIRTEPVREVKSHIKEESAGNTLTVPMVVGGGKLLNEQSIDEKLLKKHQRMIKNRQSAFESRQKQKEYVTSLEERLEQLSNENQQLRMENANLLERLKIRCSCVANNLLVGQSSMKVVSPTARKNTAIVLAMVFMVSLNFYPIGNLLTNTERVEFDRMSNDVVEYRSRGLLWSNNLTNGSIERVHTNAYRLNLTALDELTKQEIADQFPIASECPFYVNQTENIRLASELRRWIGENGYKNLTDGRGQVDVSIDTFDKMFRLKDTLDSMYRHMKDISNQMKTYERRQKLALNSGKKLSRNHRNVAVAQRSTPKGVVTFRKKVPSQDELDLYYPRVHVKYAEFFEEIGRRDDTFYLVSFSAEHLLLPALAYNKTNRPRMSLMLPTVTPGTPSTGNGTDKITLMQIDCEVMNTSMIQIREKTIPDGIHGYM
uniref:BZIP domain-containing protein n=1 Tax=Anopheles farauti TaxID=69004 RepID=A0A182QFD8_9DIPT